MNLKDCTTAELVAELMTREGVETTIAEPYEDVVVAANGPAIILIASETYNYAKEALKYYAEIEKHKKK